MGSVKELNTTGDNDPQITPTEYYRHYMYCDKCGSFNLQPWLMPANHLVISEKIRRWENISSIALKSTVLALIVVIVLMIIDLIMSGQFIISLWANTWLMISLIVVLICAGIVRNLQSKINDLGLRCGDCHTTYAHKSGFFTDLKANQMNKSIQHVPLPRNKVFWIKG